MNRHLALTLWILHLVVLPAQADEMTLTNGDRVTGTVVRFEGDSLEFESEFLGTLAASWDAITDLNSDDPLYVTFTDGQLLVGPIALDVSDVVVETADSGPVSIPRSAVDTIRSEAEHAVFLAEAERRANPSLTDRWSAAVDAGLSLTDGNSDTRTVTAGMQATRATDLDRIALYFTSLSAENATSGISVKTANAIRGGARYEVNLSGRMFTFGFTDLEFDEFQDLDLRFVLGGGLGMTVFDTPRSFFQVFGGGSSNQEFFNTGLRRKSGEAVIGENWTYRLSDIVTFTERLAFYPNLSETGEYRLTYDSTATTQLNDWLSWQFTVSDRFISNPPAGRQKNDLLFTTGIRITVGEGSGGVGPGSIEF